MRLLVHVEGQTEGQFVNEVLRDHLLAKGYRSVAAKVLGNTRREGGIAPWVEARRDIIGHLKEDVACIATTMVDYYGLPMQKGRAWPGREKAALLRSELRAACVEDAVRADIAAKLGDARRFVPFVVMHEFEGLLFSDCAAFSRGIARPDLEADFQSIRNQFPTPEDINDSVTTAPSKVVENLVPGYKRQKPLLGVLAVLEIGLTRIRQECRHFDEWLTRLESAASL
jgi:hypothetical protein